MSRAAFIGAICVIAAGIVTVTTLIFVRGDISAAPGMSEEQRATREKFFGSGKTIPPIEKGQEMRPRW